ncbi:hypothetical protein TNCV_2837791 [Trichonephila clavipes]|nr:hypothetical protein TNCV_2837791 [Trichonephila clavipes]
MMNRFSICEALAKRNEIDQFLKRMVTGDEKWVTYDNIARNRSWSKLGEAAQTVAKPGLRARMVKRLDMFDDISRPRKCIFENYESSSKTCEKCNGY